MSSKGQFFTPAEGDGESTECVHCLTKVRQAVITMETNVYLGTGAQYARRKTMANMHSCPGTKMVTRRA